MLVKTLKKFLCTDLLDIKNIIFNPKFYQHFLPSLVIKKIQSTLHTNGANKSVQCSEVHTKNQLDFINFQKVCLAHADKTRTREYGKDRTVELR